MNSNLQLLANVTLLRNGPEDVTNSTDNLDGPIDLGNNQEKRNVEEKMFLIKMRMVTYVLVTDVGDDVYW